MRFADALGATLSERETPLALALIGRVVKDAEVLVAPVKQSVPPAGTGRIRPFVMWPAEKHCPLTADDIKFHLPQTGSYPSTHAMVGWIWASILTVMAPHRAARDAPTPAGPCHPPGPRLGEPPRRVRIPLPLRC